MSEIQELIGFLGVDSRLDLKSVALTHVLDLSGSPEGCELIYAKEMLQAIIKLVGDPSNVIAKDATLVLVNVSADEKGSEKILEADSGIVKKAITEMFDENSLISDPLSMLLSNLTRPQQLVDSVLDILLEQEHTIDKLVTCFTRIEFNKKGMKLNYIGPIFSNLTQSAKGRELLCDPTKNFLLRILPFTSHSSSLVRRGGAIGILKNICFDSARHDWLLSDEVNVLPFILLPLAGPEEFTDEENDKLPIELQYLDSDKQREDDPDLRNMLLECLSQLCATRKSRDYLRSKGAYEILREYHKWENNFGKYRKALFTCENVVNILVRTEEEIGEDDLKNLDVPEDLKEKFEKYDEDETVDE